MQVFLVTLIGGFAILDSVSIGLGEQERYGYPVLSCVLIITLLVSKRSNRTTPSMRHIIEMYVAFVAIGLAMVCFQPQIRWIYVLGDFASLAMPLLLLLLTITSDRRFFDNRMLRQLTVVLLAASIVPIIVPDSWTHHSGRFEEPPLILAVLTCVRLLRPSNTKQFLGNLAVFGIGLLLTLMSGARTALLIYVAVGGSLFLLGHVSRKVAFSGLVAAAMLCLVLDSGVLTSAIPKRWGELRISRLVEQYHEIGMLEGILEDQSMNNRILEAQDALYETWHHHNWLQLVFGSGHGATFEGVTAYYEDRALADGQVHHIHFGLVLLYYRYGIPGLLIYAWLVMSALRQLIRLRRRQVAPDQYFPALIFALGTLGYLAELLLFNQLVDPVLSFTIAGFLITRDFSVSAERSLTRSRTRRCRLSTAQVYRAAQARNT
jgi:hypothetical protein